MKRLLLLLPIFALTFASCGGSESREEVVYQYTVTYMDGTTEVITTDSELSFVGDQGCIESEGCGCSSPKTERCGVRNFEMYNPSDQTTLPDTLDLAGEEIIDLEKTL